MITILQVLIFCITARQSASLLTRVQMHETLRRQIPPLKAIIPPEAIPSPAKNARGNFWQLTSILCCTRKKTILSVMLTASYMSIVLSVMTLPVSLTAIYADENFFSASIKSTLLSKIVSAGNVSNMLGKFMLGLPTDYFGGKKVLHITLLLSAAFLFGCSTSRNIYTFGAFWIAFSFVFSAAWGAIGKIIRENFLEKEWAAQLGLVYTGSRLGSILSVLLFGGILRRGILPGFKSSGWRSVFRASSAILTAVLAMSNILTRITDVGSAVDPLVDGKSPDCRPVEAAFTKRKVNDRKISGNKENVSHIVARLVTKESFWLVLASKISFVAVRQFSTFLPFYLTTGYSMNPSSATFASASFAFGSLISSAFGTRLYQALSSSLQRKLISICNFMGFILPGMLWAHHSSSIFVKNFYLNQNAVLFVISLWGVFWALPFGPAGALVLNLGGVNHVAFLINLFDAIGLFFASILSYYTLECGKVGNWGPVLLSLSLAAMVAFFSMSRAMTIQAKNDADP